MKIYIALECLVDDPSTVLGARRSLDDAKELVQTKEAQPLTWTKADWKDCNGWQSQSFRFKWFEIQETELP